MSGLQDTGAIIVHHRNFPQVLDTVRDIAREVPTARIVVVDNSDDPQLVSRLTDALPEGVHLLVVDNRGYGHAVNRAVEWFASVGNLPEYMLVSTHETRTDEGAVTALANALKANPRWGVVGPSLVTDGPSGPVFWSRGGKLTRALNEPRHIGEGEPFKAAGGAPTSRAWVDGAFCLYRVSALRTEPFREDFFLYFEETDVHARLRARGIGVGWVPSSTVYQRSDGVPPYLLGRNLQRYQAAHGGRVRQAVTVPVVILRRAIRSLTDPKSRADVRELVRGWIDGRS